MQGAEVQEVRVIRSVFKSQKWGWGRVGSPGRLFPLLYFSKAPQIPKIINVLDLIRIDWLIDFSVILGNFKRGLSSGTQGHFLCFLARWWFGVVLLEPCIVRDDSGHPAVLEGL